MTERTPSYDFVMAEYIAWRRRAETAEARVARLEAALRAHVEMFGGGPHHRDDCPSGPPEPGCPECQVNAQVEAALAESGEKEE